MVKCPFPQAFTMADSPGCCSVWARCLHCLYSCHWRKYPRQKMPTSKVERGCGRWQTRRQRLLGGNAETHCIHRQLGGRGFSPPGRKSPSDTGRPAQCRAGSWAASLGSPSINWRSAESLSPASLQCDCIWFGLLFLTFLLSLGWLYIGLILLNDLHNFNECVMCHPPLPPHTDQTTSYPVLSPHYKSSPALHGP